MALEVGQAIGNYTIVRLIGEGGFGEVYLAENPLIERCVAVKVLHSTLIQDPESVRRFLNEARAASAIRHPNIIEVLDAGRFSDGSPYIVMEFLDGVPLQKRLADVGRLSLPKVLDIARQAGAALAAAHNAGIVHRDLKPENLFLISDAMTTGAEFVKVLDFGIAKMRQGTMAASAVHTQAGFIMGSPAYMSPEQCRDSADVDLRSDIYAFGTMLYEMLAGCPPFVSASPTELMVKQLTAPPPPLRTLAADVPADVEAAIMRSLAKGREDRFDSVMGFLNALRLTSQGTALGMESQSAVGTLSVRSKGRVLAAGRIADVNRNTTFSRSSGEVEAPDPEEAGVKAMRSRRMMAVALGAVAVAGLVVFLLMRPSSESLPRTATGVPATAPSPVPVAASPHVPPSVTPAPLPTKADAGPVPAAPVAASSEKSPAPLATKPAGRIEGASVRVRTTRTTRRSRTGGRPAVPPVAPTNPYGPSSAAGF